MTPITFKEHLQSFPSIGKPYCYEVPCQEDSLDMKNIEWKEDKQCTGFCSEQKTFFQKSSLAETSKHFSETTADANVSAIVSTPFALVHASVSYTHESANSSSSASKNES